MKKILFFFAAGCLGGLANSITVWLFGYFEITTALGVSIAPTLSPSWLYPRIVWGGIWGLVFLLPVFKSNILLKGSILSLFPTTIQLFIVFPLKAHKGIAGIDLGLYTPVFILFFNWVWGFVAAFALKNSKIKG